MNPKSNLKYQILEYLKLPLVLSITLTLCLQINAGCNNSPDKQTEKSTKVETNQRLSLSKPILQPTPTPIKPPTPTPTPTKTPVPKPPTPELDFTVKEILTKANESMQNLKAFSFQIELSMELLDEVTRAGGALEALIEAKNQGLTKWIGATGHGPKHQTFN